MKWLSSQYKKKADIHGSEIRWEN